MVDEAVVGFARFFGGRHQIDELERHVAVKVLAMGLRQALYRQIMALEASRTGEPVVNRPHMAGPLGRDDSVRD
jgi:hypothetical protein